MNPICNPILWKFKKHRHLIDAFVLHRLPAFVRQSRPAPLRDEVPVFTYHVALPDWFEAHCRYLAENGYRTLSADELLAALSTSAPSTEKTVAITFDDGLKHVWTVAYPLLKKYGLKAVCFLIPGLISENGACRPTLEDYWHGRASYDQIVRLSHVDALATWPEIERMHADRIIDFQSHTMYHSLVFTSPKIFDFVHPGYDTHFYGNIHVPLYRQGGKDVVERHPILGMPIYYSQPRMTADRRFFDDERIRSKCIETACNEDPRRFFDSRDWRRVLHGVVKKERRTISNDERWERSVERDESVYRELLRSRQTIEDRLPGQTVEHLCFPWFDAKDFAIRAAKEAGFKACYFGRVEGRQTNRKGDDPFRISRLDDVYLQRLPGCGRQTVGALFKSLLELRRLSGYIDRRPAFGPAGE